MTGLKVNRYVTQTAKLPSTVPMDITFSTWTARVVRQVKRSKKEVHIKRSKVVNAGVGEERRLVSKSLLEKAIHDWMHGYRSASEAVCFDETQR